MRLAIIFGAYGAVGGDAALSAEISKSQCWMSYPSTAITGSWPPSEPESGRCANRYPSLAEALAACEHRQPQCQGVVRDAGILCSVLGSGNGSTSPLGVRMRYTFETRCCGTALRSIGATLWLPSPLPEKGTPHGGCLSVNEWAEDRGWLEAATCPTPATAAVAADVSAGVVSERMAADLLDRAMSVDTIVRRSREQVAAVDAAEAAGGRCPALSAAATDGASSSRRCPSRSSFAEQLSLMPNEPLGDCGRSSLSICAFGHRGKADGWGAQHARRAGLFVVAEQLGCAYTHQPLVGMNSHSREHGVDEIRAERFFGLGSGCVAAKRVHASEAPCIQPFGDTPVHVMPLAITHHAAASCNGTVIERYRSWKRTLSRLMVHCDDPPAVAPWSRCAWLRAVAALRRRYFAAHSGPPELRWFTEAAAEVAGVGSHSDRRRANHTGRQPLHVHAPLHLHIAVHVRRGDLHVMDHSRMIPNKAWTSALEAVSSAVAEARAHRHAHRDRVLYPSIHLISDGDLKYKSDQEALPLALEKWRRTVERHNISFYAHINEDVFETMHHMIGACAQCGQSPTQSTHRPPLINPHSSPTTHHPPLITLHSSPTTHHPPLITLHSSPTTHHPPLITHHPPLITLHSSPTTHHTPLITHQRHLPRRGRAGQEHLRLLDCGRLLFGGHPA